MILCAAVDENMGMTFHKRRQSQDKLLRKHLIEISKDSRLWMNQYTAKQFESPLPENSIIDEAFLERAGKSDYCFVENLSVAAYEVRIERIILFRWNRVYPADTYFDISLTENEWKLTSVLEFEGSSHKKITKEIWEHEKEDI